MARRSAGTGARTPTGTPPGARPAALCRNGPAPARPPWRPSAGTAIITDGPPSTASDLRVQADSSVVRSTSVPDVVDQVGHPLALDDRGVVEQQGFGHAAGAEERPARPEHR